MKTTMTLAASLNCNPFEIFNQDTDEVILIINYYIALGGAESAEKSDLPKKQERIRVNDKTATGGWY